MRGSDLLGLLRRLFGFLGAELILRPVGLKIGGAEMICNKGRIGQVRLAILSGLVGWPSRQLLVRCAKYGPC
jgi:hypothetical protein